MYNKISQYSEKFKTTTLKRKSIKMTDIAALRTYLKDPIGLGLNATGTDRANAVIAEGIHSIDNLIDLYEDDGIKTLWQNVKKQAGNIPNPSWVRPNPNPVGATAPHIPIPGHQIPIICKQRLNLAAYGETLYSSIGRVIDTANLTRSRLREFKRHKEMVTNHKKPEAMNELSKTFTIAKFLDQFPTYLRDLLGTNNVALSYVIRTTAEVPTTLPALTALKTWSAPHTNMMDDLISYTPHDGPSFGSDNARVYTLLSSTLSGTSVMASINRYQSIRNGREASLSLITHNMGSSK